MDTSNGRRKTREFFSGVSIHVYYICLSIVCQICINSRLNGPVRMRLLINDKSTNFSTLRIAIKGFTNLNLRGNKIYVMRMSGIQNAAYFTFEKTLLVIR